MCVKWELDKNLTGVRLFMYARSMRVRKPTVYIYVKRIKTFQLKCFMLSYISCVTSARMYIISILLSQEVISNEYVRSRCISAFIE